MVEGSIGEKLRIAWMKKKMIKMAATNGDFLGRFTDCFAKKTAPAADGASKKKIKVEEGA